MIGLTDEKILMVEYGKTAIYSKFSREKTTLRLNCQTFSFTSQN